ncbi:MAG: hypothetical protein Q9226_005572 [Calogaya cf. arnoldii]
MEPLSIAASLLTVLEATAVVSKATISLYRNVRDAPKELECLANHISRTRVRLDGQVQLYQGLNSGNLAKWIPDEALEAFHADLEKAKACLESVQDIVSARSNHSNSKHRFSWVAQDKRKVNKLLGNLRDIDNKLSAMLHTMSLLSWPCFKYSWAFKEILPRDSLFVKACIAGNVEEVKQLALSGKGMPSSIDEVGTPMLHYAISSGSLELVRFLLHNGATPDDLAAQSQESPLQEACRYGHSDIARLLLAKGAFLEHTDVGGRTALTMLWFQLSTHFSRADFLRLLLAYSPMPSVFDPSEAVGPFACAAMRGKVEDLELLIHTGLGMNCNDMAATRTVKYSIFGSNLATYEYLVQRLPRGWVHDVDQMGRGPLHIALEWCGYHVEEIVRSLIDRGADVHLIDLNGNNPGDVARICDERAAYHRKQPGNVRKYFDALRSCGFDVELGQDNNLWWAS